jgi:hypothetical protein
MNAFNGLSLPFEKHVLKLLSKTLLRGATLLLVDPPSCFEKYYLKYIIFSLTMYVVGGSLSVNGVCW